jgi:hypothetical protein
MQALRRSAVRLLVRPSTRQHVWLSLPDPMACATGGLVQQVRLRCGATPKMAERAGCATARWQGEGGSIKWALAQSKEGIRTTHHHFIIGSFGLTSGDEICRWLRRAGARVRKKKDGSSTKKLLQDRGRPPFQFNWCRFGLRPSIGRRSHSRREGSLLAAAGCWDQIAGAGLGVLRIVEPQLSCDRQV